MSKIKTSKSTVKIFFMVLCSIILIAEGTIMGMRFTSQNHLNMSLFIGTGAVVGSIYAAIVSWSFNVRLLSGICFQIVSMIIMLPSVYIVSFFVAFFVFIFHMIESVIGIMGFGDTAMLVLLIAIIIIILKKVVVVIWF